MSVERMISIITKSTQHTFLYHFTDASNFGGIKQHGLLCKDELQRLKISPSAPGGNDWSWEADAIKGLTGFVNLCFTRNHPMCHIAQKEGKIHDPRYLAISPEILKKPGIKVALDVANKKGVELLDFPECFPQIDLEVIYKRTDWRDPEINSRLCAAEKCEVLIPKRVPLKYIKKVF